MTGGLYVMLEVNNNTSGLQQQHLFLFYSLIECPNRDRNMFRIECSLVGLSAGKYNHLHVSVSSGCGASCTATAAFKSMT